MRIREEERSEKERKGGKIEGQERSGVRMREEERREDRRIGEEWSENERRGKDSILMFHGKILRKLFIN